MAASFSSLNPSLLSKDSLDRTFETVKATCFACKKGLKCSLHNINQSTSFDKFKLNELTRTCHDKKGRNNLS